MIDARNVVIFMSDSIRWGKTPQKISSKGVSIKTIAASPHTPSSLASMLTGLWLPQHGVRGFTDVLPKKVETILDRYPNQSLSDVGGTLNDKMLGEFFNDTIYNYLFNRYPRKSLDQIEEPFGWFMRDPGGHAPYGGWDIEMNASMSVPDFFDKYAGNQDVLRDKYDEGITSSVKRFQEYVIKPLKKRNILDDTLIIFLSDHGELLGEYGHVGQSYPICPELVYVPTIFIHPDLETSETEIMRHVDLPDTIAHLTDRQRMVNTPGTSVFDEEYDHQKGYCLYNRQFPSFKGEFSYQIDSLWDKNGGHVFNRSTLWEKTKLTLGYLSKISAGKHLRRTRKVDGFRLLYTNQQTWGSPEISPEGADAELKAINEESVESASRTMSADTEEQLRDLGYL